MATARIKFLQKSVEISLMIGYSGIKQLMNGGFYIPNKDSKDTDALLTASGKDQPKHPCPANCVAQP